MDGKYGTILNIRLDGTQPTVVLRKIQDFIARGQKFYVVTPNPEIILASQKDKDLANILNRADISLPDGVGLAMAFKYLEMKTPRNLLLKIPVAFVQGLVVGASVFLNRSWLESDINLIRGREMFLKLCDLANKKKWHTFLLGGRSGVSKKAAEVLARSLKGIKLESADGPELDLDAKPITQKDIDIEKNIIERINKFSPQLLFVGFGCPRQEKWVNKHLPKLNIGGAMVVGGSFDYVAGKLKLPPSWMADLGLEWFWRLLKDPSRIKRILTAFPIFPLKIFWYKLWKS